MDKLRILFVTGICAAISAIAFSWGVPTRCVQLPNGMNIGKQALIDLNRPYFRPDIVPKFRNGRSLLPGDAWPFFTTETTVHGLALEADPEDDFWFAWREDTGLILKKENLPLYEKLVSEAGAPMGNKGINAVDSHVVMIELQRRPEYANETCRTRWITFGTGNL